MKKVAVAEIRWLNNGRTNLPKGRTYKPTIRFLKDEQLWSVFIFLDDGMIGDFDQNKMVNVGFISDDFPYARLIEEKEFVITEGAKPVASCKLVGFRDL